MGAGASLSEHQAQSACHTDGSLDDLVSLIQKAEPQKLKAILGRLDESHRQILCKSLKGGEDSLAPGSVVRIRDLKSASHLNGLKGTCVALKSDKDRWEVSFKGGELKALKPANLEMVFDESLKPQVVKMPSDPQLWGMTVQQLWDFGIEVFGSFDAMIPTTHPKPGTKDLNMYDVVTKIVKPKTKPLNLSQAVFMNSTEPLRAKLFVSHAWAELFSYFVFSLALACLDDDQAATTKGEAMSADAIRKMYAPLFGWMDGYLPPETVIWVCALAINQNADIQGELGGDILQSPFARVLRACDMVVVLFNRESDLYTRVWCVLECYLANEKKEKEPSFKILPVGLSAVGQFPDKEWIMSKVPDQLDLWKKDVEEVALARFREAKCDDLDEASARRFTLEAAAKHAVSEKIATKFVDDNPRKVEDAKASVEKDREDILKLISPMKDEVNSLVRKLRKDQIRGSAFLPFADSIIYKIV